MLVGMWLAGGIGAAARRVGGGPSAVQWPRDVRWAAVIELAMAECRRGIARVSALSRNPVGPHHVACHQIVGDEACEEHSILGIKFPHSSSA